jgi:hypothetical protein
MNWLHLILFLVVIVIVVTVGMKWMAKPSGAGEDYEAFEDYD